jgi:hypothetical protein
MQQFKLSRLALLKNDEHAMLIEQVCRILDDHPVDDGHVRKAAEKVKSHLDALKGIKCRSGKHALTPVLAELEEKRRRALISLKMRVKAALWSPLSEENEPARVLKFWLDKQGERPVNGSCMARTRCVDEMLQEAVCDAAVGEALAALNLMPLADYLRETNEAFKAAFMQRNEEWAREEKPDSRAVRKAADKDVKLLMNVLVVQAAMEGESRYRELTGELGRLFAYYWNTLAVRKGRRTAEKTKEGTQTSPAIAERKGHQVAAAEKEANSRPANTGIPSRAPVVRALTPHENLARPAIGDARKERRAAAAEEETETRQEIVGVRKSKKVKMTEKAEEEKKETESPSAIGDARKERRIAAAEEDTETRQAIVGVRKSKKVKMAEKAEEEKKETESPSAIGGMKKGRRIATVEEETETLPVNTEVPAKTPLVQAAMPHKSIALPDRNVGLGSDMPSG